MFLREVSHGQFVLSRGRKRRAIYTNRNRISTGLMASVAGSSCRRLVGKVAVVTGSTYGIGFAIAKRLGSEGAHVMISSRKQASVDNALKELQAANLSVSGMVCHVGNAEHRTKLLKETVAKYGGIDILVCNAAVNPAVGPVLKTTEEKWDKVFDINVKSTFFLIKECVPYMLERKGASVVIHSSLGGFTFPPNIAAYNISKTALLGMNKALASELGPMGIRVNCIAPGPINTNFIKAMWNMPSLYERHIASLAIKRIGEPEECAGAVAFLCSDDASYITGETVCIGGGVHARL